MRVLGEPVKRQYRWRDIWVPKSFDYDEGTPLSNSKGFANHRDSSQRGEIARSAAIPSIWNLSGRGSVQTFPERAKLW